MKTRSRYLIIVLLSLLIVFMMFFHYGYHNAAHTYTNLRIESIKNQELKKIIHGYTEQSLLNMPDYENIYNAINQTRHKTIYAINNRFENLSEEHHEIYIHYRATQILKLSLLHEGYFHKILRSILALGSGISFPIQCELSRQDAVYRPVNIKVICTIERHHWKLK